MGVVLSACRHFLKTSDKSFSIDPDVIIANLIERIVQVRLYVVEADKNKTEQYGQYEYQVGMLTCFQASEVRSVGDWQYNDEEVAVGAKARWRSVLIDVFDAFECRHPLAQVLIAS